MRGTRATLNAVSLLGALGLGSFGCVEGVARFPLREPLRVDTDLKPFKAPCRSDDKGERLCAPEEYFSPIVWDGADNLVFRPLSDALAVRSTTEAVNANSLDEVADSAWFTNRLGARPFGLEDLRRGPCKPEQLLDATTAAASSWLIDQGKPNGASPGFRVKVPVQGKYMFKSDAPVVERPSAASVIGAAVYHAAGYFTSCEQIVYFHPSILTLKPGLKSSANFEGGTETAIGGPRFFHRKGRRAEGENWGAATMRQLRCVARFVSLERTT